MAQLSQLSVIAKGASGRQNIYIYSFDCIVKFTVDCVCLINRFDGIHRAWSVSGRSVMAATIIICGRLQERWCSV